MISEVMCEQILAELGRRHKLSKRQMFEQEPYVRMVLQAIADLGGSITFSSFSAESSPDATNQSDHNA